MAAAVSSPASSPRPSVQPPRGVRLTRAAVLFLGGMAIAFSATLHEQLSFDSGVSAAILLTLALAHAVEWCSAPPRSPGRGPATILIALAAIAAAVALFFVESPATFAVTLAAWALMSGVLEFVGSALQSRARQDALFMGGLGILLAILLLLVREDQVAALGFLGAYAVIGGVFLGIAAFDTKAARAETADTARADAAGENTSTAADPASN